MSKVQTFEEWMDKTLWGECFVGQDRANMRAVWQAAHENAARIAESLDLGRPDSDYQEGFNDGSAESAKAIREAAK